MLDHNHIRWDFLISNYIKCNKYNQYGKNSHNSQDRTDQLFPGALCLSLRAKPCRLSGLLLGDLRSAHIEILLSLLQLLLIKPINR